mgnify:CR=1 FL=1
MSNGRAQAGGQIGVNGEHYKGGTFLPSTHRPKGIAKSRTAPRRMLVEPGVLAVVPEGETAIFEGLQQFVHVTVTDKKLVARFPDDHTAVRYYFDSPAAMHALIAAYNAGQRFQ